MKRDRHCLVFTTKLDKETNQLISCAVVERLDRASMP